MQNDRRRIEPAKYVDIECDIGGKEGVPRYSGISRHGLA